MPGQPSFLKGWCHVARSAISILSHMQVAAAAASHPGRSFTTGLRFSRMIQVQSTDIQPTISPKALSGACRHAQVCPRTKPLEPAALTAELRSRQAKPIISRSSGEPPLPVRRPFHNFHASTYLHGSALPVLKLAFGLGGACAFREPFFQLVTTGLPDLVHQ